MLELYNTVGVDCHVTDAAVVELACWVGGSELSEIGYRSILENHSKWILLPSHGSHAFIDGGEYM